MYICVYMYMCIFVYVYMYMYINVNTSIFKYVVESYRCMYASIYAFSDIRHVNCRPLDAPAGITDRPYDMTAPHPPKRCRERMCWQPLAMTQC